MPPSAMAAESPFASAFFFEKGKRRRRRCLETRVSRSIFYFLFLIYFLFISYFVEGNRLLFFFYLCTRGGKKICRRAAVRACHPTRHGNALFPPMRNRANKGQTRGAPLS
ncbi:hypothetical protein TW95_gp0444 [Pandoravirus inopinatum]|uniref:Transmembrane protein n=1 Tax=Pandoravirus inopinatum TaxID=1605721 RepID=A0A0B5IWW1_9VIRU|nr:hypothetical protein TW95_gp0444 [Pandoravirus inopinatum]AJF97178.1 hypothetical protein [Pandoravirus inopinatum]